MIDNDQSNKMETYSYDKIILLKDSAAKLSETEVIRIKKILYPLQSHDFQIKSELNKLTWQTYSDVIKILKSRIETDDNLKYEIIREVINASIVQQLYSALYAQIISQICDDSFNNDILNKIFDLLTEYENNVRNLKGLSQFLTHWLVHNNILFNSILDRILAIPTKSQIILFSAVFKDDMDTLKKCPDLYARLISFCDDNTIPFQYKVDLFTIKDQFEKNTFEQEKEINVCDDWEDITN